MLLASIPFDSGLFGTVWFESTLNIVASNRRHPLMGSSPLTSSNRGIVKWYNSVKRLICIRLHSALNLARHAKVLGSIPGTSAIIWGSSSTG